MQTLSFVTINLHRCWPREWKHSIIYGDVPLDRSCFFPLCPKQSLNRVYNAWESFQIINRILPARLIWFARWNDFALKVYKSDNYNWQLPINGIKVFRYSFWETIPMFFNHLKSDFILVRSLLLTLNWSCQNVVFSKIDITITTIKNKFWNR